jgi:hypothetical protein
LVPVGVVNRYQRSPFVPVAGSNRYQRPLRPISSPNGHQHFTRARKPPQPQCRVPSPAAPGHTSPSPSPSPRRRPQLSYVVIARSSPTSSTLSPSPAALLRRQGGERPSSPLVPSSGSAPRRCGRRLACLAAARTCSVARRRPLTARACHPFNELATSTSPSMPLHRARARCRPCREHIAVHAASTSPSMHAHVAHLDVVVHNGLPVEVR